MRREHKTISVVAVIIAFVATVLLLPGLISAADEPGPPADQTDEVFSDVTQRVPFYVIPTRVEKTGQTMIYFNGDDGDLQKGVAWPNPRFTDNGDGTVTDNLTGLIWLKNANCWEAGTWYDALNHCNDLADGECGLEDGSVAGDWRLPNVKELQSLIYYAVYNPALSDTAGTSKWTEGDAFTGVLSNYYWSSTYLGTLVGLGRAWRVNFFTGLVNESLTASNCYAWPVRSSN
jgi:hypothetical protein